MMVLEGKVLSHQKSVYGCVISVDVFGVEDSGLVCPCEEAFAASGRADSPLQCEVDGEKANCFVPIGGREGEV